MSCSCGIQPLHRDVEVALERELDRVVERQLTAGPSPGTCTQRRSGQPAAAVFAASRISSLIRASLICAAAGLGPVTSATSNGREADRIETVSLLFLLCSSVRYPGRRCESDRGRVALGAVRLGRRRRGPAPIHARLTAAPNAWTSGRSARAAPGEDLAHPRRASATGSCSRWRARSRRDRSDARGSPRPPIVLDQARQLGLEAFELFPLLPQLGHRGLENGFRSAPI